MCAFSKPHAPTNWHRLGRGEGDKHDDADARGARPSRQGRAMAASLRNGQKGVLHVGFFEGDVRTIQVFYRGNCLAAAGLTVGSMCNRWRAPPDKKAYSVYAQRREDCLRDAASVVIGRTPKAQAANLARAIARRQIT
jgi:hypothetical protein